MVEQPRRGLSIETIQWENYEAVDFCKHFDFLTPDEALFFNQLIICMECLDDEGEDPLKDYALSQDAEGDHGNEFTFQFIVNVSAISEDTREKLKQGLMIIASSD